jgi:hypothetical protein
MNVNVHNIGRYGWVKPVFSILFTKKQVSTTVVVGTAWLIIILKTTYSVETPN